MNAVMITGISGAGKTTIAAVLAHRGLASIDADDDPLLARSVAPAGHVVEDPAAPSHTLAGSAASRASKPSNQLYDGWPA
jgi:predicted ATPase